MPPASGAVRYRLARVADAAASATLHVESWRVAYRGMFPDDFLDNDAVADRAKVWPERFADPDLEQTTITILAEGGGELMGFAHDHRRGRDVRDATRQPACPQNGAPQRHRNATDDGDG